MCQTALAAGCALAVGWGLSGRAPLAAGAAAGQFLYVAMPSSESRSSASGIAVLVYDIEADHKLVKRISLRASDGETVRGILTETSESGRIYISTSRRLAAIDPAGGRILWERTFGDRCCDRGALSPDGFTLYVPAFGEPVWYVVNAATGQLIDTVKAIGHPRSTAVSPTGNRAYLASWGWNRLLVLDTLTRTVTSQIGPFGGDLCPFTLNQRGTLAFVNIDGLVGFEVADLTSGQILDRVQIAGYSAAELAQFECPSSGIAFTPNEKELWVADGIGNKIRIFDATPYPPVEIASVSLARQPRWITFSRDGRFGYSSTGDVIAVSSRRMAGTIQDERGAVVESERLVSR